jgi:cation transport regulator ChaB
MLANATGNSANLARAHLQTAKAFAGFAERSRDALLAENKTHSVAWGLALLARVTGEPSYRELAHAIAQSLVAQQSEKGTWHNTSLDLERVDQTAETALCLFEMSSI